MLRGRRFPRVRRGRRLLRRSGYRRSKPSQLRRTRRASTSTRSSGNINKDYCRVSRRIEEVNARQFPTIGQPASSRFSIAWYTGTAATPRGQVIDSTGDLGTITSPAALSPGTGQTPLPYTIAGYYSVNLGDIPEFSGDNFANYRYYRIKSFRVSLTSRTPVFTAVPGQTYAAYGAGGTEVMLVNTGKSGEFVLNCPLTDTAHIITQENNPWNQVLNRGNVKEISVKKRIRTDRATTLSMKVNAMETYVYQEPVQFSIMGPASDTAIEPAFLSVLPPQQAVSLSGTAVAYGNTPARFCFKRRPFRWTRQWLQWWNPSGIGDQVMYIRNDLKRADGIQVMIRDNTYMQSSLPYFNVNITVQIEFKQPSIVPVDQTDILIGDSLLFPFTNATYDH